MRIKAGVSLAGLKIEMRDVLKAADLVWTHLGRKEGVTVTSGLNGLHSAGSYHYYGYALDFRTYYFGGVTKMDAWRRLKNRLKRISPCYDVAIEKDHIHVEYDYDRSQMPIP